MCLCVEREEGGAGTGARTRLDFEGEALEVSKAAWETIYLGK